MITILLVIAKFFSFQPFLDGKDLDIELDSTADSEKEDSDEEEDDDPFSNAPPRQEPMYQRTVMLYLLDKLKPNTVFPHIGPSLEKFPRSHNIV